MHLGHGHSLINPCRRSSEDPLQRVDFALRLQTHNGVAVSEEAAYVVSAGDGAVGQYRYEWHVGGVRHRNQLTGWYFTQVVDGVNDWWGLFDASDTLRGYGATPLAANPAEAAPYSVCGDPVSQLVPNYAPLGLYQDLACTVPATTEGHPIAAWRDELTPSGLTAVQAEGEKRGVLHFINGVPCVRTDSVDDGYTIPGCDALMPYVIEVLAACPLGNPGSIGRLVNSSANVFIQPNRTSNGPHFVNGILGSSAVMDTQFHSMAIECVSGQNAKAYTDAVDVTTLSRASVDWPAVGIGAVGAWSETEAGADLISLCIYPPEHRLIVQPYIQNLMPR